MVKAAKGDNSEQLPIVFTVPKFLSTQLDDDCAKYTGTANPNPNLNPPCLTFCFYFRECTWGEPGNEVTAV